MTTDVLANDLTHPAAAEIELTAVLAALAEPARLTAVRVLAEYGESSCTDLRERGGLTCSKSTLSHHLKILREAGLAHMRLVGSRKYVTLRRADLDARWPGLLTAVLLEERSS